MAFSCVEYFVLLFFFCSDDNDDVFTIAIPLLLLSCNQIPKHSMHLLNGLCVFWGDNSYCI